MNNNKERKKAMLRAGRSFLHANKGETADSYRLKQILALAVTDHTALEQTEVLNALRLEFAKRAR